MTLLSIVIIIVVSLLAFAGALVLIVYFAKPKAHVEPSKKKKLNCGVYPFTDLVKCDPKAKDKGICTSCKDMRHCYTVNKATPYKYLTKDKTIVEVPDGNWCLPLKMEKPAECNPYSGTYVLTEESPTKYKWACHCKYPNLFEIDPKTGDCTVELACGHQKDPPAGKLVCPPAPFNKGACTAGSAWTKTSMWDPKDGVCSCILGLKPQSYESGGEIFRTCKQDTCEPGGHIDPKDPKNCVCKKGYIRCPKDVGPKFKGPCLTAPTCIKDPCNPPYGYYDATTNNCKCTPYLSVALLSDPNSPIGTTCINPCKLYKDKDIYTGKDKDVGMCGNRGTCVNLENTTNLEKSYWCNPCNLPWYQDNSSDKCKKMQKDVGSKNRCFTHEVDGKIINRDCLAYCCSNLGGQEGQECQPWDNTCSCYQEPCSEWKGCEMPGGNAVCYDRSQNKPNCCSVVHGPGDACKEGDKSCVCSHAECK